MTHLTTFKACGYTTLQKVFKNCGDKTQWQQTRRAHTEENNNEIHIINAIVVSINFQIYNFELYFSSCLPRQKLH